MPDLGRGSERGDVVGRSQDVTGARRLLSRFPLVTLTGVGGVGKTQVALAVARQVRRAFAHVGLVDLARLPPEGSPAELVASALEVAVPDGSLSTTEHLVEYLASRPTLVVLDTCDHVVDETARLVDVLLTSCPQLRIIATSREPLRVAGEAVLSIPPLAVPPPDRSPASLQLVSGSRRISPAELERIPAVALFLRLLRDGGAPSRLSSQDRSAVGELCRRLDGLPLAIQLAADLVAADSSRLTDPLPDVSSWLDLPIRGATESSYGPRHRTLRACVRWSQQRCSPAEQLLWARLSVFEGAFELEDVERVCLGGDLGGDLGAEDLLDVLTALVDKSIVAREEPCGVARYRLASSVRAFGAAQLRERDEQTSVRHRHLDRYRQLVATVVAEWAGPAQAGGLHRLDRGWPDVRAALETGVGEPGLAHVVLETAIGLLPYWLVRGWFEEGRRWLERALDPAPAGAGPAGAALRARAQLALAVLQAQQGDLDAAGVAIERARSADPDGRDPDLVAILDHVAGVLSLVEGDSPGAVRLFERATQRFRERRDGVGHLESLTGLAVASALTGDVTRVHAVRESVSSLVADAAPLGAVTSSYLVTSTWAVGLAEWRRGARREAAEAAREGLRRARSLGDAPGAMRCLAVLAWLAADDHEPGRAAVLLGAVAELAQGMAIPPVAFPGLRIDHTRCEQAARRALGAAAFRTTVARGRGLGVVDAVDVALGEPPPRHRSSPGTAVEPSTSRGGPVRPRLTRREREVAELVGEGLTNREIAHRLAIAPRTAEGHVESILAKLGVSSRTQVAVWLAEQEAAQEAADP